MNSCVPVFPDVGANAGGDVGAGCWRRTRPVMASRRDVIVGIHDSNYRSVDPPPICVNQVLMFGAMSKSRPNLSMCGVCRER